MGLDYQAATDTPLDDMPADSKALVMKANGNWAVVTKDAIKGNTGAAGTPGSVWRDGSAIPSNGSGVDGDYYLRTSNGDVYLRTSGSYSIVGNIKGATGGTGSNGTNGTNGAPGSVWRSGSGAPSNGTGIDGDYYLRTSNGDVYTRASGTYSVTGNIKGADGADGMDGNAGANGLGFLFRGAWANNNEITYSINDVVKDNGNLYITIANVAGDISTSNETYWSLFLPKGEDGLGFTYLGGWGNNVYVLNDVVTYNGSVYVAVATTLADQDPATDTTNWALMVPKPADGANGSNGGDGAAGLSYATTSSTFIPTIGSTNVITNQSVAYGIGSRMRLTNPGDTASYVEGFVTYVNSNSDYTVNLDYNSPAFSGGSDWVVSLTGDRGINGLNGLSYNTTSTSTIAVPTIGSAEVVTAGPVAFGIGSRMRLADPGNPSVNYSEGNVTAVTSNTQFTVFIDYQAPGFMDGATWGVSLIGARGQDGSAIDLTALDELTDLTTLVKDDLMLIKVGENNKKIRVGVLLNALLRAAGLETSQPIAFLDGTDLAQLRIFGDQIRINDGGELYAKYLMAETSIQLNNAGNQFTVTSAGDVTVNGQLNVPNMALSAGATGSLYSTAGAVMIA